MFDFNTLCDFSRTNCLSICAFLVPATLVATLANNDFHSTRSPESSGVASRWNCQHLCSSDDISRIYLVPGWGGDGSHLYIAVAGNQLSFHQPRGDRLQSLVSLADCSRYSCANSATDQALLIVPKQEFPGIIGVL